MSASTTACPSTDGAASPPRKSHRKGHSRHLHGGGKKGFDPFLDMGDGTVDLPTPPRQPHENGDGHSDTLLADLVLTPINMIAFVLSLTLVDNRQRQWRLSQHAQPTPPPATLWARLTHPRAWLAPNPYQDAADTTWQPDDGTAAQPSRVGADPAAREGWYGRKKKRAVLRMEVADAFEMRGRVLVALVVWAALAVAVLYYGSRYVYTRMAL